MENLRTLTVPTTGARTELYVKRSRFLAECFALKDHERIHAMVSSLRKKHPKANHVAWASITGPHNQQTLRFSDDGEPKGTAGRPVLSILQKQQRTNILVTIVRYFGGIKLGTGGLVKAYSTAALQALEQSTFVPLVKKVSFQVICSYEQYQVLLPILQKAGVESPDTQFTDQVTLSSSIVETTYASLREQLTNLFHGRIQIQLTSET